MIKISFTPQSIITTLSLIISSILIVLSLFIFFKKAPLALTNKKVVASKVAENKIHSSLIKLETLPIFGEYISSNNADDIPNTMLNIQLIGTMKSSIPGSSQAIIKVGSNEEKLYLIDDTLPGGGKLIRVLDNAVLLKNNGKVERLSLPKDPLNINAKQAPLQFED